MPEAIVCIFVKPPNPGAVKTRLIPELGPERAAELAEALLEDTVAMVRTLPWAECIIAATKTFERSLLQARRSLAAIGRRPGRPAGKSLAAGAQAQANRAGHWRGQPRPSRRLH